jgi:hypothetical protein
MARGKHRFGRHGRKRHRKRSLDDDDEILVVTSKRPVAPEIVVNWNIDDFRRAVEDAASPKKRAPRKKKQKEDPGLSILEAAQKPVRKFRIVQ